MNEQNERDRWTIIADRIEYSIRRIVFPILGSVGIGHSQVEGNADPILIPVYLAMMGLGVPTLIEAISKRKGDG